MLRRHGLHVVDARAGVDQVVVRTEGGDKAPSMTPAQGHKRCGLVTISIRRNTLSVGWAELRGKPRDDAVPTTCLERLIGKVGTAARVRSQR
jgi:hypothetical protein